MWLNQLLFSLKNQDQVDIELLWRDDGSIDRSRSIVAMYEGIKKVHCDHIDIRLGAAASFMHLLEHDIDAEYIAFCDQDDVWDKNKLHRAIGILEKTPETSHAYSSKIRNLETGEIWPKQSIVPHPINSLTENIMTGCTVVINQEFKNLLSRYSKPMNLLHDEWIYLVGVFHAEITYDASPSIGYRVHRDNATGIPAAHGNFTLKKIKRFVRIFRLIHRYKLKRSIVNGVFCLNESDTGFKEIQILSTPLIKRRFYMTSNLKFRQNAFENWIFKLLWLLGII
jgi:glycosyltransferase involved in cell wall biosynthesis